jgi:plastocyanin
LNIGHSAPIIALGLAALGSGCAPAPSAGSGYTPQTREITVTTVPLLVREGKSVYPFLDADLAPDGVLEGKEVYAFSPSTITVVEGDTVRFTLINPEDDEHAFLIPGCTGADGGSFVLPDCGVDLPPQHVTHATYIARRAGIYPFYCKVTKHLPMMWGQLVVLAPAAMAGAPQ